MKSFFSSKLKATVLCFFSAFLLALPFYKGSLWVSAWFAFLPLFAVIEGKNRRKAFLYSCLCGVVFWAGTIYWLAHVTLPGTIILVLYLALYFGFFGLIASCLLHTTYYLLLIPCTWVLLEYIRGYLFTGFPWALLGYSQCFNLPVIQIADITGVWGVSFLVMLVNAGIYSLLRKRSGAVCNFRVFLVSLFFLLFVLAYGYYKIYEITGEQKNAQRIKISVIQANIAQDLKWDARAKDFIFRQYLTLSAMAAKERPDLIIWPEAASPAVIGEEPLYFEQIKSFTQRAGIPLLFGAVSSQEGIYYNSALMLSAQADLAGIYHKLHLVPFGEYIPLRRVFGFLETVVPIGEMTAGREYTLFSLPANPYLLPFSATKIGGLAGSIGEKFSVLICFEDLFPGLSREFRRRGADFLVNITNDAWYKETPAAFQHFQASVFRAVENRSFLARAANTGISGFIDPLGRVSLLADSAGKTIFIKGYKTEEIALYNSPLPFYSRYGDIFIFVCFFFVFCAVISALKWFYLSGQALKD